MGTLRSMTDHTGLQVNGVTLGSPTGDLDDSDQPVPPWRWDDSRLPNGEIDEFGNITVDMEELS